MDGERETKGGCSTIQPGSERITIIELVGRRSEDSCRVVWPIPTTYNRKHPDTETWKISIFHGFRQTMPSSR